MTNQELDALCRLHAAAMEAGQRVAREIRAGDVFRGALADAAAAGFPAGSRAASTFVHGYLEALKGRFPRGVLVDADGCIVAEAV